ncbi:hypothetical protein HY439_02435 [Candidatus Microgenomates bacterium]|nr:hypothetical protein [Candidatus Microgenomates bacterium]
MSRFLEKYVREPIEALLKEVPEATQELPALTLVMNPSQLVINIEGETLIINRSPEPADYAEESALPEDINEETAAP